MYRSGESTRDIAASFGTTHTTIRRVLKNRGVELRGRKEAAEKQSRYNTCVVCGTEFRARRTPSCNLNRKTCSKECLSKLQKEQSRGEKSGNWKGGYSQAHYQRVRRELKEDKCESCGATDRRLDTHHLDRDKSNNALENIVVLCASCHAFLHYIEDDRGLQGWNAAKSQELKDRTRYVVGR